MMTMSKIASLAHVSVSTVSKAFSMSSEVNSETREMIFEIARKHGCFKKFYTAKYPGYVIAIICPEFQSRCYSTWLSSLQKKLTAYNCEICVAATDFSNESVKNLLEYYDKYTSVDGIIVLEGTMDIPVNIELPVVSIGATGKQDGVISVEIDYLPPIIEVLEHFKKRGISHIGYIGEKYTVDKKNKFKTAMTQVFGSYNEDMIYEVDDRFESGGYKAMAHLIETGNIPRIVLCGYDNMAIGAMRYIGEKGLSIPSDIALVGFNNIPEAKYLSPSLSSIDPDTDKICDIVVNAIIDRLSDKETEKELTVVPVLRMRESTNI